MFNYTKERNSYTYYFSTNENVNYKVLFKPESVSLVEVALEKVDDTIGDSNSVFEIMETVTQILNDHLSVYPLVDTIILNVIGDSSKEIDQKSKMYVKYSKYLNGNWTSNISTGSIILKKN